MAKLRNTFMDEDGRMVTLGAREGKKTKGFVQNELPTSFC